MEKVRAGGPIRPIKLSEFLEKHPPREPAHVQTGAWNVASTSGVDFSQWNGSENQKKGVTEVIEVSRKWWELQGKAEKSARPEALEKLARARRLVLEAETSCYLFWGDNWVPRLYERTNPARDLLRQVEESVGAGRPVAAGASGRR